MVTGHQVDWVSRSHLPCSRLRSAIRLPNLGETQTQRTFALYPKLYPMKTQTGLAHLLVVICTNSACASRCAETRINKATLLAVNFFGELEKGFLSPQRLPFRHPGAGSTNLANTDTHCNNTSKWERHRVYGAARERM